MCVGGGGEGGVIKYVTSLYYSTVQEEPTYVISADGVIQANYNNEIKDFICCININKNNQLKLAEGNIYLQTFPTFSSTRKPVPSPSVPL